jgi:hypothetical protein
MAHDSPLAGMLRFVDGRVHTDGCRRARKRFIKASLFDIGAETIYGLEAGRSIDREKVRP